MAVPQLTQIAADIRMVRCNNPSPLTGPGTNSFLIGRSEIAVIDPGPQDAAHMDALLAAVPEDGAITKILVTHSHLDHSPMARDLASATRAPVYAFGPDGSGRSEIMSQLPQVGGGEGRDTEFAPNHSLTDGQTLNHEHSVIHCHWTPGHYGNHMCFGWGSHAFTGDLVMSWATTLVSPPDGDLTDFLSSCEKMAALPYATYHPAHGAQIDKPKDRLRDLIAHRKSREAQVLSLLEKSPADPQTLTQAIYTDVTPELWPAAQRNVLAHLIDLTTRNIVSHTGPLTPDTIFHLR